MPYFNAAQLNKITVESQERIKTERLKYLMPIIDNALTEATAQAYKGKRYSFFELGKVGDSKEEVELDGEYIIDYLLDNYGFKVNRFKPQVNDSLPFVYRITW